MILMMTLMTTLKTMMIVKNNIQRAEASVLLCRSFLSVTFMREIFSCIIVVETRIHLL